MIVRELKSSLTLLLVSAIAILATACATIKPQIATPTFTLTSTLTPTTTPTQIPTSTPTPMPTPFGGGGRIAFTGANDANRDGIYLINPDGSGLVASAKSQFSNYWPAWSPDGTKIAFASSRDGILEIYVMNADGSAAIRLTNNPRRSYSPAWSPDGTKIAFSSERDGKKNIYVMNADGSAVTQLTKNAAGNDAPAWSPDGKMIAFLSGTQLCIMGADGSSIKCLAKSYSKPS